MNAAEDSSHEIVPRPRIALYSHDTMGIGHMRRNLLIAQTLTASPVNGRVLMMAGACEAGVFASHAGIDCVTLPALHKDECGRYSARNLHMSLSEIINLRRRTIRAAMEAFQPDVLIVDKVPRGVANELDETLGDLSRSGNTRCVLGFRDILDTPAVVDGEWQAGDYRRAIEDHFDQVWVYGDSTVFNSVNEYSLHDIAGRVRFTGYLDQTERLRTAAQAGRAHEPVLFNACDELVACFVGGGQDGFSLASAFCQSQFPARTSGVVLAGPCMPEHDRRVLRRLAEASPRLQFVDSMIEADFLMRSADRVIAMGGYNTVSSILSFDKPALIVPRVTPREEQLIRAERLHELGLVEMLHPTSLSPARISEWLLNPSAPRPASRTLVDMNGLDCISALVCELVQPAITSRPSPEPVCHAR